jgi:hypothetical protein
MERRGPVPKDVCQHRSPPRRGGAVRCQGTHGSTRALLDGEAGSNAEGCVAALELS